MKMPIKKHPIQLVEPLNSKSLDFYLDTIFIVGGFLLGMLYSLLKTNYLKIYFPDSNFILLCDTLSTFATFTLWGAAGLVWVIRQEIYQVAFKITGTPAILLGMLTMLIGWGLAMYALILNIPKIFGSIG